MFTNIIIIIFIGKMFHSIIHAPLQIKNFASRVLLTSRYKFRDFLMKREFLKAINNSNIYIYTRMRETHSRANY